MGASVVRNAIADQRADLSHRQSGRQTVGRRVKHIVTEHGLVGQGFRCRICSHRRHVYRAPIRFRLIGSVPLSSFSSTGNTELVRALPIAICGAHSAVLHHWQRQIERLDIVKLNPYDSSMARLYGWIYIGPRRTEVVKLLSVVRCTIKAMREKEYVMKVGPQPATSESVPANR